jgi:hypothetical protein
MMLLVRASLFLTAVGACGKFPGFLPPVLVIDGRLENGWLLLAAI